MPQPNDNAACWVPARPKPDYAALVREGQAMVDALSKNQAATLASGVARLTKALADLTGVPL